MNAIVRNITSDELPRMLANLGTGIVGSPIPPEEGERFAAILELDRTFCAFDGDDMVGTSANFSLTMTVPGGEAGCAGVTMVTVQPTHRRRGIMSQMMRRMLDDARSHGEPLAALWASEESIYQRYGFGMAANEAHVDIERDRMTLLEGPSEGAQVRLISPNEAVKVLPEVYDRVRPQVPGMLARSEEWWRHHRLSDPEHRREGAGPLTCGVLERDGHLEGYVLYRIKPRFKHNGVVAHTLKLEELVGDGARAQHDLWRYIFGIDLVERIQGWFLPSDLVLTLSVTEPRRLGFGTSESFWVRLVDVEAALNARSYEPGTPVVLEVVDAYCDWNAGRYRVSPTGAARTEEEPDLKLDVGTLAAIYLGEFTFHRLARSLRVEELKEGALRRADRLFQTSRAPWCPESF